MLSSASHKGQMTREEKLLSKRNFGKIISIATVAATTIALVDVRLTYYPAALPDDVTFVISSYNNTLSKCNLGDTDLRISIYFLCNVLFAPYLDYSRCILFFYYYLTVRDK